MKCALAAVAGLGVTLSVAGCGGRATPSPSSGAVAFSHCMRAHGVPSYPDPGTDGRLPKKTLAQLRVSGSEFDAAQGACLHLAPHGGQPTAAEVQRYRTVMLRYAACIRSHGVPTMPDPDSRGHLDIGPDTAVDVNGPVFQAAYRVCKKDLEP
jgi:hypothetical protein